LIGPRSTGPRYCPTHAPDHVAILRAIAGDHSVTLYPHERLEAIRTLASRGVIDAEIAARLGVSDRTVQRIRVAHNIPSLNRLDQGATA
jgi:predicted DNA-binding protein (UPF0251 family)